MSFEPIAIVGQSCVLPGALTPAELWDAVASGRSQIGGPPAGAWRVAPERILGAGPDRAVSDRGGYVRGFEELFDAGGFALPAGDLLALDRRFQWLLHAAREALRSAGEPRGAAGAIFGNLAYPSALQAQLAEAEWLGGVARPHPLNRFSSPGHVLARALRLPLGALALDAACASSLYAIRLACDRLHDRRADVMLAGGVNCADDLFIHVGFTALGALSRSGQTRPFHRDADGLVPAEGAALVVLKRLADAVAAGDRILGVIRGVGLSNDGRGKGMLAPSAAGQERAMRAAYEMAGIAPADVSLVECHATGTVVGDATEIASMRRVFAGCREVPIGSLKSNLGHLITAAGAAGLLKVLGALAAGVRPPTLSADSPIAELSGSPFRLVRAAESWDAPGPRRAAVSGFGFGGNNAHLLVEEWRPGAPVAVALARPRCDLAVVGLGAVGASGGSAAELARTLFSGASDVTGGRARMNEVAVPRARLRTPPADLERTLPQQLALLAAAEEAVAGTPLPAERTGAYVGMLCDNEAARFGARWRRPDAAAIAPALDAAGVVGAMPNIVANRLNGHLDLGGPSFTVSADERSGVAALELAARALRRGELDVALAGAVDLSCEPVHEAAARAVLPADRQTPGDAAVMLVLMRLDDARRDGREVLAILPDSDEDFPRLELDVTPQLGHAHAASGLLQVVAAVLACHHRALPGGAGRPARPWLPAPEPRGVTVEITGLDGGRDRVRVVEDATRPGRPLLAAPAPRVQVFSGADRRAVLRALAGGHESDAGPARLALVAGDADRLAAARRFLEGDAAAPPDGVFYRDAPIGGELGFVFTMAAAGYAGMGRELLLALPELADRVAPRFRTMRAATEAPSGTDLHAQLLGYSLLTQAHAELSRGLLGLRPDAAIGLCTGESAALFALGAWDDMDGMFAAVAASGLYERELAGDFAAVRRAWRAAGVTDEPRWATWRVRRPVDEVRAALAAEPLAHLAIVHAPADCLLVGQAAAVERVIAKLGAQHARHLGAGMAIHCPEVAEWADGWRAVHHRPTRTVPGVRFYSHASGTHYQPSADLAADALVGHAVASIDFRRVIENAWRDGVRVFVEHGPRALCSEWIHEILGEREHVAVALDGPLGATLHAVAALAAAGVPVDHRALGERLATRAPDLGPVLRLPAHPPAVQVPDQAMAPAPSLLPPVVDIAAPRPRRAAAASPFGVVLDAHRRFVELQGRVHTAFLDGRGRALAQAAPAPAPVPVPVPVPAPPPPRLRLGRAELETLATGRISSVLGPRFAGQDGYRRQVRMPAPPLLLADRVTELDGEPGSMGLGTIRTETDVTPDAWYMHDGRMPAGIVIESGQADLLLISWLGADLLNRGERVYRLLGCELTYHGGLPRPGETLRYEIHVDGHASQGDVRLFFFHYDCLVSGAPRLTVRGGQAGFFTDEELAASAGILWDPREAPPRPARLDPPARLSTRTALGRDELAAFIEGRVLDCFGPGFERAETHLCTPRLPGGRMRLLDRVTDLDARGGPWGRGYLRAVTPIAPDDWFFAGHFKDDPCMPGTLMFEGCLQAMATYLAALGFTLDRDAWRFEPVPEERYAMRCRGQVTPASRELVYELFVSELHDGPLPTLYADLLCTVDGLKAFHCRRMGLRLVPDWPMDRLRESESANAERRLLASAWGKPSDAFGAMYRDYDGARRAPRLPGPPYHFMTRIAQVTGEPGGGKAGAAVVAEYDVPADAWYFAEHGARTMPFCVLLEAALQPCGWLASWAGCALGPDDLMFRNLDGNGAVSGEVLPDAGTLVTRATLRSVSRSSGMVIVSFAVACSVGGREVFTTDAVFGFFPAEALAGQAALPAGPEERAALDAPCDVTLDPATLRPAGSRLAMLDRVTGYWPRGGRAGLGRLRAEKDVRPSEWFFKAHFFQDPVQPGSLGIEAMLQLLELHMRQAGLGTRFEPIAVERKVSWRYRGQVRPEARLVTVTLDVIEVTPDERGVVAVADASLWCDGARIYNVPALALRGLSDDVVLDPARDRWLADHAPTYTTPALAMTELVDRMAAAARRAAPGRLVIGARDVQLLGWIAIDGPTRLRFETRPLGPEEIEVTVLHAAGKAATGRILLGDAYPAPPPPLPPLDDDARPVPDPYASGELFHGPAFQQVRSLARGPRGASSLLAAESGVPLGVVNPGLLDAAFHGIPHDDPRCWAAGAPADHVMFPARLDELTLHGPTPAAGTVRCEARFEGLIEGRFVSRVQLATERGLWATLRLVDAFVPRTRLGADRLGRRRFLAERAAVPGVALSRLDDDATRLSLPELRAARWFPGFIEGVYAVDGELDAMARAIAVKDHIARRVGVHPSTVRVDDDGSAVCAAQPFTRHPVAVTRAGLTCEVREAGRPTLDPEPARRWWRAATGAAGWPGEELLFAAARRFVGRVVLADPEAFAAVAGQGVLYLANHQVGVESMLFTTLMSGLSGVATAALAKAEHAGTWVGRLEDHLRRYPGIALPTSMVFFDRSDKGQLLRILADVKSGLVARRRSLLIHVEGTRARRCRQPVVKLSGAILDLAVGAGLPVVPVRFAGALPADELPERGEFPVGYGAQDIHIGRPIAAAELAAIPYAERKRHVLCAMNAGVEDEQPCAPDPDFARAVAARVARTGAGEPEAVLLELAAGTDGVWLAELARMLRA